MVRPSPSELQRLLAAEFEANGWEYDLSVGRVLVERVERSHRIDLPDLARAVPGGFLARTRATRSDIEAAIASAWGHIIPIEPPVRRAGLTEMRLLLVSASPRQQNTLRLDAESRDIYSRIRASTGRERVRITTALATRPTDLIDELNRFRPTALHLAGHGGPLGITLEDNDGYAADVTSDQLKRLVHHADAPLRLVVLNSCESALHAKPLTEHIDAAIGMGRAVGDDAARTFSAQLYASLAERVPVSLAFEQAKLQISLAGLDEDDTPKLFARKGIDAADMVLLD